MDENVQVVIVLGVVFLVGRWLLRSTSSSSSTSTSNQHRRGRQVTQEQIDSVIACFPQASRAAVQWDLQRTGSVQQTCENILNLGTLPQPPESFFEQLEQTSASSAPLNPLSSTNTPPPSQPHTTTSSTPLSSTRLGGSSGSHYPTLIARYGLQARVEIEDAEAAEQSSNTDDQDTTASSSKGKAKQTENKWDSDPERRGDMLREKKIQMILGARRAIIAKDRKAAEAKLQS